MRNWYEVKANGSVLNLSIHDEIGLYGVSAKEFIKALREQKAINRVELSIHSPGGSMFDGLAIYNALADHPAKVHVRIEGVANSAASVIAMAGDTITMPEDTWMMIHNPWTVAMGNAEEMRETADLLDRFASSLANIYVKRTGLPLETVQDLMAEETWMTAAEAVDYGFADAVDAAVGVAALSRDFARHFSKVPETLCDAQGDIDRITSLKEFEGYLREAGWSNKQATSLACRVKKIAQSESDAVVESENEAKALEAIASFISKF